MRGQDQRLHTMDMHSLRAKAQKTTNNSPRALTRTDTQNMSCLELEPSVSLMVCTRSERKQFDE